ncbi:MAG: ribonuclease P protein component [Bacilli bacterium]
MNKDFIIRKNEDIQKIINCGKKKVNKFFVVYYINNSINHDRFVLSVGKKIGNAVVRNKVKRQLKEILRKNMTYNSRDYVIIVRNGINALDYIYKERELMSLLKGDKN